MAGTDAHGILALWWEDSSSEALIGGAYGVAWNVLEFCGTFYIGP